MHACTTYGAAATTPSIMMLQCPSRTSTRRLCCVPEGTTERNVQYGIGSGRHYAVVSVRWLCNGGRCFWINYCCYHHAGLEIFTCIHMYTCGFRIHQTDYSVWSGVPLHAERASAKIVTHTSQTSSLSRRKIAHDMHTLYPTCRRFFGRLLA